MISIRLLEIRQTYWNITYGTVRQVDTSIVFIDFIQYEECVVSGCFLTDLR